MSVNPEKIFAKLTVPVSLALEYMNTPHEERPQMILALEAAVSSLPTDEEMEAVTQEKLDEMSTNAAVKAAVIIHPGFQLKDAETVSPQYGTFKRYHKMLAGLSQEAVMTGLEVLRINPNSRRFEFKPIKLYTL